jgi:hypothetical protein
MKEPQYTLELLKLQACKGSVGYQRFDIDFASKTLHPHDKHKIKSDLLLDYMSKVMPGKSVIEIGSDKGLYSYLAHKFGARSIIVNDKSRKLAKYRRLLFKCLGVSAEFSEENFFKNIEFPQADCVIALAVLHEIEQGTLEEKIKRIREMSLECSLIEFCEDYQLRFGNYWNVESFKRIAERYYRHINLVAQYEAIGGDPGTRYIFDCRS